MASNTGFFDPLLNVSAYRIKRPNVSLHRPGERPSAVVQRHGTGRWFQYARACDCDEIRPIWKRRPYADSCYSRYPVIEFRLSMSLSTSTVLKEGKRSYKSVALN